MCVLPAIQGGKAKICSQIRLLKLLLSANCSGKTLHPFRPARFAHFAHMELFDKIRPIPEKLQKLQKSVPIRILA